ncbi:Cytochrome P450 [Mycena chlorophos]|uniref:Cytochrome P450 n=1 Tax=Mycena chlorophos TaxID=658473 RepID=A0A8H6T4Q5_MYCCL|nr:Cytochrome P450 [Mycena chlorophos]
MYVFAFLGASLLVCALVWLRSSPRVLHALPLPPGPQTNWLGTVNNLPKVRPWLIYGGDWRQKFGDLVYIKVFRNPILILNSAQVVSDLLEKRGGVFSSRPSRTMLELVGWDWLVSMFPYSSKLTQHRHMIHRHLPANESSIKYHDLQIQEARNLCRLLSETPGQFRTHIRTASASIVLRMSYGETVDTAQYIPLADQALSSLAQAGIFGTYLVDYLPILKHAPPWFSFKRKALAWRPPVRAMRDEPFTAVKQHIAQGHATHCLVSEELERLACDADRAENEKVIANVASTLFAAGADTVVSAIAAFFLVMALHPEIQAKAQQDLDDVLGGLRLPTFADRAQLPFIEWIINELLRWRPVTPLGLPHYTSEECSYAGYRIPAGTTIVANVWAILHDPEIYPDPDTFNPWRYGDQQGGRNPFPDPAFGFGRRFCPGKHLALDTLFIIIATTLAVFTVTDDGEKPSTEFTPHSLSHPLPFGCTITKRATAHDLIIDEKM